MGGPCGMRGREEKCMQDLAGKASGVETVGIQFVDGRRLCKMCVKIRRGRLALDCSDSR